MVFGRYFSQSAFIASAQGLGSRSVSKYRDSDSSQNPVTACRFSPSAPASTKTRDRGCRRTGAAGR